MQADDQTDELDTDLMDTVATAHVAVDVEERGEHLRQFSCRELPLGKLELFDITIDPVAIHRSIENIYRDDNDDFLLSTQVEGTVIVKVADTEFIQRPGDLAIMSAGEPYSIIHTQRSHRLILHIPKTLFLERILSHQVGRTFKPQLVAAGGLASIVHEMLKALGFEADKLQITEQFTLAECLLELTSTVLRSGANQEYEQEHVKQSALFRRILEFIEANYTDCELTPQKIANANCISMRYLHSLFHHAGMTVSKWMWERRLKATREDLLDPGMHNKRISEIAFQRGFNDTAHFSRAFKKRFDISPSQLRQLAQKQQQQP